MWTAEFMHTGLLASSSLWVGHDTLILHENIQHVSPVFENSGIESFGWSFCVAASPIPEKAKLMNEG